jgi:hypothetical protein
VLFKFSLLLILLNFTVGCYNGDKTLIPKVPFVPLEVEEGFNLVFEPKVDILFLIDDSGSMSSFQDKVAQNMKLFTDQMKKNKFLDYQIGVISTTYELPRQVDKSGKLQGKPNFVTRNTVDGLTSLEKNIRGLGISGSASEMFFDPLAAAISPSLNLNPGFIRSDAFFVLIIVSDSYDQSESNSGFKVYDTLVNLKAYDRDKILGYSVLAYPEYFEDNCSREETEPNNLFEFMGSFTNSLNTQIGGGISFIPRDPDVPVAFRKLTNVFSLCDPNFGQKLADIGDDIRIRVSQKIPLPVRPVDGTIKLKYGTQVIDEKWWKYDFGTNSIILDPLVELDETQVDAQLFVVMDQSDPLTTIGNPE